VGNVFATVGTRNAAVDVAQRPQFRRLAVSVSHKLNQPRAQLETAKAAPSPSTNGEWVRHRFRPKHPKFATDSWHSFLQLLRTEVRRDASRQTRSHPRAPPPHTFHRGHTLVKT
jgi:hypothetical protein